MSGIPTPAASVVDRRERLLALLVALGAGIVVFWIASSVFPYHSSNHDEGVYLQQAAMLLDGQIRLAPGDDLVDAVRPWFFVRDGGTLYPKYSPVVAAVFAPSMALLGEPRASLALVAATNVLLIYALGSTAFDRSVGVIAAALFAISPMALVTSSVFLPYAPTTMFNLAFAFLYLRSVREAHRPSAALAGACIGIAFFARPFTALLFALPFVLYAALDIVRGVRDVDPWPLPDPAVRNLLTAGIGLGFVALALAYNAVLTGSALVFPYEAFAPLDGPGFGRRRILDHSIEYTPTLGIVANGHTLWYLFSRWFAGGLLGSALALGGLVIAVASGTRRRLFPTDDRWTPLAGLFVTIPVGNLTFWGNYNILATMGDPNDGLVSQFGPFYHFDLLAPLSIFAALFLVVGWRWASERFDGVSRKRPGRSTAVVVAVLLCVILGGTSVVLASDPIDRNLAYTERYETAYAPLENTDRSNALVFLPTPYGPWMNHPFQYLRNDPGFDGPTVYALSGESDRDFAVLDRYPDRSAYRFVHRGRWDSNPGRDVDTALHPISVRSGTVLRGETTVGAPDGVERARIRLETDAGDSVVYSVADPGRSVRVGWTLDRAGAMLDAVGDDGSAASIDRTDTVVLTVTFVDHDGSTFTYRQETAVRRTPGGVEAIWPSVRRTCPLVLDCGSEGTYLPGHPDTYRSWERFDTSLEELSR